MFPSLNLCVFTGRSVTLVWLHLSLKVLETWWREWTSTGFTLIIVRRLQLLSLFSLMNFVVNLNDTLSCWILLSPVSPVQEQQTHPHHHPQPSRAHHRRRRRLHRLHPLDAVCWRAGPPALQPIRRDQGMAPQGQSVAKRPLPLLRSSCCPYAGMRYRHFTDFLIFYIHYLVGIIYININNLIVLYPITCITPSITDCLSWIQMIWRILWFSDGKF